MASITSLCVLIGFLSIATGAPSTTDNYKIEVPKECKGKRFCSVPPKNYEIIQERINELLPQHLKSSIEQRMDIGKEVQSPKSDWQNCAYVTRVEVPHWLFSDDKNSYELVAQTDLFQQRITVTECEPNNIKAVTKHPHSGGKTYTIECFHGLNLQSYFMNTRCVQHHALHQIVIYDNDIHRLELKKVEVPVSCTCKNEEAN